MGYKVGLKSLASRRAITGHLGRYIDSLNRIISGIMYYEAHSSLAPNY